MFDSTALGAPDLTGDEYFADCEVTVTGKFINQRVAPCPMEVRGSAAAWIDGRLNQWASTQHAQGIKDVFAAGNKLEADDVRVRTPDVGGGFGAKIGTYPEEIVLGELSKRLDRPVRWTESRSESMMGLGHGRAQVQTITLGGSRDGTVTHYRLARPPGLRRLLRHGGDPRPVHDPADVVGCVRDPEHRVPHDLGRDQHDADRRLPRRRPPRGHGRHRAGDGPLRPRDRHGPGRRPAQEPDRAVQRAAHHGHRSDLRRRRLRRARSTASLEAAGYDELRAEQKQRRESGDNLQLGIGVSIYVEITGGVGTGENAKIEMHDDGTATIYTGTSPHGQGHDTAWSQIASAKTGIPIDKFELVWGDTDLTPRGDGTMGSRSLQQGGAAVDKAAIELVEAAKPLAARALEAAEADIELDVETGTFHVAGTPAVSKSWADLADAGRRRAASR